MWIEHEGFLEMVDTVWKQDFGSEVMSRILYKLKALQPVLRQLNKKEFQYIGKKIKKARSELEDLQDKIYNQAQDDLVNQEKELLIQLEKWSLLEENALRQKARARWITLGDTNIKYVSAVIKERNQKKHIEVYYH